MRLFGKSGSDALEPAWNYSVAGAIWRIHPTAGGALVGEERRIDEKKTVFFCLDHENGQELWQQASPGHEWWVGIEAVHRDTVLFHGFANPNLPQHRGIIAVDLLTGKKLWEDTDLEFVGMEADSILAVRETSTRPSLEAVDRRSGAKRGDVDVAELRTGKVHRGEPENEIKAPEPLEQLAEHDPQAEAAVRNHLHAGTPAGPAEAVVQERFVVFDYHEASREGTADHPLFTSVIKIVDRSTGALLYDDTVSTGVRAVIPGLFFVQHDMLYYIKERQSLIAVRLAS